MAKLQKIDSNSTGLRYAIEESIGVLPTTPDWVPLEPNTYTEFGGSTTTVARNPINAGRQRKKGVTTDLDASGGFNNDLTQTNLQDLLQAFYFADLRRKGEEPVTNVDGTADEYDVAETAGFQVGTLAFASKFAEAANNGLKNVTAVTLDTSIGVSQDLVDEAAPPAGAGLVAVGFQGVAGDIDVDVAGSFPALTSTALDFTTLGLIVGEFIFVGGDTALTAFTNAENNGFKRVRTIAANRLEFDKSDQNMVAEASTTETIQLFFGRVLKNESDPALQVRRTAQLERTLGAPESTTPAALQSEYLVGSVANELTLNIPTADKLTADLGFIAIDNEQRTDIEGLKTGNRPALEESDAFNTSSDFTRIRLAEVDDTDEAPEPLFAFVTELTLNVSNNASPNKAVGVLGAFEVTVGQFTVGGNITAYFADVAAIKSVRDNADVTLDFHLAKQNSGVSFDLPLIALGDGRANVEQDQPITLPLTTEAATGAKIDPNLDHTSLLVFYDYLPDAADT